MKNQAQLITYVDRLSGGTFGDLQRLLEGPLREAFGGVHVLPFFYPIDGADGSVLYRQGDTFEHPGCAGPVADTVGAGDAFTAALVLGLLEGHDLARIGAFANRLAAYVCSRPGATPPIPPEILAGR